MVLIYTICLISAPRGPAYSRLVSNAPPEGPPRAITKQKSKTEARQSASRTRIPGAVRCRRKFLRFFPGGFADAKYNTWERQYKWDAHQRWQEELNPERYRELLIRGRYIEIADRAVAIEARTNLLFSFEKMAIRDAVRSIGGACAFATGLYHYLFDVENAGERFQHWRAALERLPRRQTRVTTWPVATVFPFIARPDEHIFLKPNVTRIAAEEYEFTFEYKSQLSWETYHSLLQSVAVCCSDSQGSARSGTKGYDRHPVVHMDGRIG